MKNAVRKALRRSVDQVRHVDPVEPGDASGTVAAVYGQLERDFGMIAPPIALHSPSPVATAASWAMLRESLVAEGLAPRAAKEAVATAVSVANECPYCVEVHDATLRGLLPGSSVAAAVASGDLDAVEDREVRHAAQWAGSRTTLAGAAGGPPSPFPEEWLPELIGTAVTFQYLNRMVNVFLGESALPSALPGAIRSRMMSATGKLLGPDEVPAAGDSLDLLPSAPAACELAWASGNTVVSEAFARAGAAVDGSAADTLPARVRDAVEKAVDAWDGEPPPIGRAWLDDALTGLPVEDRPAGELALLTALASYRVDEGVVEAFRAGHPADAELVVVTAWASLVAARRIGGWARQEATPVGGPAPVIAPCP